MIWLRFGKNIGEGRDPCHCIVSGLHDIHNITGDVKLDHLIKVVPAISSLQLPISGTLHSLFPKLPYGIIFLPSKELSWTFVVM